MSLQWGFPFILLKLSNPMPVCAPIGRLSSTLLGLWYPHQVTPMHGHFPQLAQTLNPALSHHHHHRSMRTPFSPCTGSSSLHSTRGTLLRFGHPPCAELLPWGHALLAPLRLWHPILGCTIAWVSSSLCQFIFLVQTCRSYFAISVIVLPYF